MVDFYDLARQGFKIIDGRLCNSYGVTISYSNFKLNEFGWSSPCTEYHFDDFDYRDYSIVKAVHYDEWYLVKNGYERV